MKQIKYNYVYNIGDKVKIKELKVKGVICGILISVGEIIYKVRYFINLKPEEIYFTQEELEIVEEEPIALGFK